MIGGLLLLLTIPVSFLSWSFEVKCGLQNIMGLKIKTLHVLCLMVFWGQIQNYMMRVNMSILGQIFFLWIWLTHLTQIVSVESGWDNNHYCVHFWQKCPWYLINKFFNMTKIKNRILNITFCLLWIFIIFSAAKTEKKNPLINKKFVFSLSAIEKNS